MKSDGPKEVECCIYGPHRALLKATNEIEIDTPTTVKTKSPYWGMLPVLGMKLKWG